MLQGKLELEILVAVSVLHEELGLFCWTLASRAGSLDWNPSLAFAVLEANLQSRTLPEPDFRVPQETTLLVSAEVFEDVQQLLVVERNFEGGQQLVVVGKRFEDLEMGSLGWGRASWMAPSGRSSCCSARISATSATASAE